MHLAGWRPETQEMKSAITEDQHVDSLLVKPVLQPLLGLGESYVDLRPWMSPVEDQRDIGSCVANSVVGALEFLELAAGGPFVDLSRMFVYYNSRLEHNDTDNDNGTYINLAMGTLKKMGVCPEPAYPYDTSRVFLRPTWEAYRDAYAHTIVESYNIPVDGMLHANIRKAIDTRHPVVFGARVWPEIQTVGGDGMLKMPDTTKPAIGGHAMLIVGYDMANNLYIVRNSWGTGYGVKGYLYMPFSYLDVSGANDFWVATLFR